MKDLAYEIEEEAGLQQHVEKLALKGATVSRTV